MRRETRLAVVLAHARRLRAAALRVHFLTRGYGGARAGPARVQPGVDDSDAVGDEALLLAAAAPTWVARWRRCKRRGPAMALPCWKPIERQESTVYRVPGPVPAVWRSLPIL